MLRGCRLLATWVASMALFGVMQSYAAPPDIVLGQSVALSGPAQKLGHEIRLGAKIYFDQINANGGIRGRQIVLRTLDDGYEPQRAEANTRQLVADPATLALFGYVGTPTSAASIPLALQERVPFFGAFTGAELLRSPLKRYVFNVRASYFDETEVMIQYMTKAGLTRFAVFYQNDAYGQAGLEGVERALAKRQLPLVGKATVERNTTDVAAAVKIMETLKPEAIILVSAYTSCAAFIKQAKAKGLLTQYVNLSFVGSQALAKALGNDAYGVMISQVMPPPTANKYGVIQDYQKAMLAASVEDLSYTGLEGYVAARILVEALRRGGDASREALVKAIESIDNLDLNGFRVSFGPNKHDGSHFVEMTVLNKAGAIRY